MNRFPQDIKTKNAWLRNLEISAKEATKICSTSRICSEHFQKQDFIQSSSRKFLREGVLPTLTPVNNEGTEMADVLPGPSSRKK